MDSAVGIRACSVATDEAIRPGVAFMFPGQGSQRVGMSKDLCESFAAARLVMEEVDEALQQRLSRMMMEGDQVRWLSSSLTCETFTLQTLAVTACRTI